MTATQALLWALVIAASCIAGGMFVGFTAAWLKERAYQRAREQEYADAWQRLHRVHQHDRHDHADERKPE